MRLLHLRFAAFLGAAFLAAPAAFAAQSETSTGAAATINPLQVMGQGARPLAMGSAFTAVKGDLMAALFNPAGQAYLRGAQAAAHHHSWLGGINQDSIAAVLAGKALSVGLYGDLVNYGAIQGFDELGNETEAYTPMDFTLGVAVAKQFSTGLALGGTVRGTQQSLKESGQLINSGDLGLMWASNAQPVTLGIAYANLGPTVAGKATTSALRLGFSYDLPLTARSSALFAVGGSGLNNGASVVQAGVEGRLGGVFFLRAGYQMSFLDNKTGGLTGLSSGLGAKVGALVLDYAYLPYGRIGNSHRLSVSFQFDDGSNAAPAAPKTEVKKPKQAVSTSPAPAAAAPSPAPVTSTGPASVDMVFEVPSSQEELLLQATRERPQDAQAWKALGRHYFQTKDKARMLEAFERAVVLDPGDLALKEWLDRIKQ